MGPHMRVLSASFSVAALISLAAASASAAPIIVDTTTTWNGSHSVLPWGQSSSNSEVYGQSLVAPAGATSLHSFSFFIDDDGGAQGFHAVVQEWSDADNHAVGPVLFSSGSLTTAGSDGFTEIAIDTGGIAVTAGTTYILYFSVNGETGSTTEFASWGFNGTQPDGIDSDVLAGGGFHFFNTTNDADLSTTSWSDFCCNAGNSDLAFTATFNAPGRTPVPEPATLALLGLGLAGLGLIRRRASAA